ncbi:hypothetical protein RKLH11_1535 [Rhodobacteraceae bacterium KLH11]|nr:hypothetical protein RKLH11_1535 [Rhodobacteraceae bacterium KLH11]
MILLCFAIGLLTTHGSQAEGEDYSIQLGSRQFYTGEEIPSIGAEPDFIPLNRIDWLNDLLSANPILDNTVIHIKKLNQTSDFLWSPTGPGDVYIYPEPVPEHLRLPGYTVNSFSKNSVRLLYLTPKSSNKQFALGCSAEKDSETYEYCGLRARYPLDPRIIVLTRIYQPPPTDELIEFFDDIAEITVGIALCLDITDQRDINAKKEARAYLETDQGYLSRFCEHAVSS